MFINYCLSNKVVELCKIFYVKCEGQGLIRQADSCAINGIPDHTSSGKKGRETKGW